MGRHSTPAEPPEDAAPPHPPFTWWTRAGLATAAAVSTGAVTAWAGLQWWAAVTAAVGVAVVVLLAAWAAATVPGPPGHG